MLNNLLEAMDIPPKIRIPLCIEQGSVFNFQLQFVGPKRQSKNRYFVVLNRNPKSDVVLIMVTPTTQIAKRIEFVKQAGISESTIVLVSPTDYPTFTSKCAFNCNDVYEVSLTDLIRKIEENGSMNYPKMSAGVLAKILTAVKRSPSIAPTTKELL